METETKEIFLVNSAFFDGYRGDVYQDVEVFASFSGALEHLLRKAKEMQDVGWGFELEVHKEPVAREATTLEKLQEGWRDGWYLVKCTFAGRGDPQFWLEITRTKLN